MEVTVRPRAPRTRAFDSAALRAHEPDHRVAHRGIGKREPHAARRDEREPAWWHVGDRERPYSWLARRNGGLGDDRDARTRGDEVADEPHAFDLKRNRERQPLVA